MDALIEAFGSYSIGYVVVLVAAFIFLYKIYKEELNTHCDMFLRYSEGDIPFVF